jgi:hypothetical protein
MPPISEILMASCPRRLQALQKRRPFHKKGLDQFPHRSLNTTKSAHKPRGTKGAFPSWPCKRICHASPRTGKPHLLQDFPSVLLFGVEAQIDSKNDWLHFPIGLRSINLPAKACISPYCCANRSPEPTEPTSVNLPLCPRFSHLLEHFAFSVPRS